MALHTYNLSTPEKSEVQNQPRTPETLSRKEEQKEGWKKNRKGRKGGGENKVGEDKGKREEKERNCEISIKQGI